MTQATLEAMSHIFENVSRIDDVAEFRPRGGEILIGVNWSIDAPMEHSILTATVGVAGTSPRGEVFNISESGTYNHVLTAVDDGAVRYAAVDAFQRIMSRLQNDGRLRAYALAAPKEPVAVATPQARSRPGGTGQPSRPSPTTLADVSMTAEPQTVRIRESTDLKLRYSLVGEQGQLPVRETLTLSFDGKVLTGYPRKTEVTRGPGTHTSTYRQTIPERAQPGSYRYAGEVCLGDDCRSHSGNFEVLP